MASAKELAMESKGMVVAGLGLGALLVAVGACSQASRSDTPPKNGSSTQRDNAPSADAQVMACTDVTAVPQIGGFLTTDAPTMNGFFLPHGSMPPAPTPTTDIAPTCDKPLPMPPVAAGSDFHYQSYTFANDGDAATCVSVVFDLGFIKSGPRVDVLSGVETLAYLDHFDPTDIEKNYLAGYFGLEFGNGMPAPNTAAFPSAAAGIMAPFSFKVPAHAKFVVVVSGKESPPQDVPPGQTALWFPYVLDVTNCTGTSSGGNDNDAGTTSGGNDNDAGTSSGGNDNDAGTSSGCDENDAGTSSGGNDNDAGTSSGGTGQTS